MNPEVNKRLLKLPPKRITIITLVTFILLMVAICVQFSYSVLSYDKIYKGVYIGGVYAGSISTDELRDILNKSYQDKAADQVLSITAKDASESLNFSDIGVKYDIEGAVKEAYDVGRTGNIFSRLYKVYKASKQGVRFDLPVQYDRGKVDEAVDSLYSKTVIEVKEADLLIGDDKVSIRSGHSGEAIDRDKALIDIDDSIKSCEGRNIEVPVLKTEPSKINIEDYYNKITREVRDASIKVQDNKALFVPEVVGRNIDKNALVSAVEELQNTEDTEKTLPVTFIQPKVTTNDVSKNLFRDTLGTMSTKFDTSTTNNAHRGENIKLGTSKVNGKILAPGEIFSFNDVVGPRTAAEGYLEAHAYAAGEIVDSSGGGICQVSTTLYNAVLLSDLQIVRRTNHSFTVAYVPLGRDATVAYDSVDFQFKNNTNWPVKIEGWVSSDHRVHFEIKGTNEDPGKVVEINSKTISTTNYKTKYIDDPSLPVGTTRVKTSGMKGYLVDTYKVVKINGQVVSEAKISTSNYRTLDREVIRGTKKVAATPPVQPAPTIKPTPAAPAVPALNPADTIDPAPGEEN